MIKGQLHRNYYRLVYATLCIIIHFMRCVCPESKWSMRMRELIGTLSEIPFASTIDMGFSDNWEQQSFWTK